MSVFEPTGIPKMEIAGLIVEILLQRMFLQAQD